jgi:hypothetical protein
MDNGNPIDPLDEDALGVTTPNATQLADIEGAVNQALGLMRVIDELEEALKAQRADLHKLVTGTIPDAMGAAGTIKFTTHAGVAVSIKDFVNGSLPREDEKPAERAEALTWLINNGASDIVKTTIVCALGRGDYKQALKIKAAITKLKLGYVEKEDVHPMTLAAFARERLKKGEKVPLETLGLYAGRAAKIDLPKAKGPTS